MYQVRHAVVVRPRAGPDSQAGESPQDRRASDQDIGQVRELFNTRKSFLGSILLTRQLVIFLRNSSLAFQRQQYGHMLRWQP